MYGAGSSPWIREMDERAKLDGPEQVGTDIVVVGGGIAGMSTAFYLLRTGGWKVTVLERDLIGHGSSGRNGGQGVAAMERSFAQLLETMEPTGVAAVLNDLESGYWRLRELSQEVEYDAGPYDAVVWSGLSSIGEVKRFIEEMDLRRRYGAPHRSLTIAEEHSTEIQVPQEMRHFISYRSVASIQLLLNTKERYIAAFPTPVSLVNSGRLCWFVHRYLAANYPDRYRLHEGREVVSIDLQGRPTVRTDLGPMTCRYVVLCTNGYVPPTISAAQPPIIERALRCYVASMVAYERSVRSKPSAYIYYHEEGDPEEEPYFYLTRRPYAVTGNDLVAVGGPQTVLEGRMDHDAQYPQGVYDRIHSFMGRSYPEDIGPPSLRWNGLMGYTENGLRLVGPDPKVGGLWYNLGCNGVGLLSSIVGGHAIASMMAGPDLEELGKAPYI